MDVSVFAVTLASAKKDSSGLVHGGTMKQLLLGCEKHGRSLAKAISWRTTGTIDTFVISYFVTGRVGLAGAIAGVEIVTKIVLYYFHERVWAAIPWGHRRASGESVEEHLAPALAAEQQRRGARTA